LERKAIGIGLQASGFRLQEIKSISSSFSFLLPPDAPRQTPDASRLDLNLPVHIIEFNYIIVGILKNIISLQPIFHTK
jgi:hypothetical protein